MQNFFDVISARQRDVPRKEFASTTVETPITDGTFMAALGPSATEQLGSPWAADAPTPVSMFDLASTQEDPRQKEKAK